MIQQVLPHLRADFGGLERKLFVRPLAFNLEGRNSGKRFPQVIFRASADGGKILFHFTGAGVSGDSEYFGDPLSGVVEVGAPLRTDIDGRLRFAHVEPAEPPNAAADVFPQDFFKGVAVQPFQDDFAQFDQNDFLHGIPFLCQNGRFTREARPFLRARTNVSASSFVLNRLKLRRRAEPMRSFGRPMARRT